MRVKKVLRPNHLSLMLVFFGIVGLSCKARRDESDTKGFAASRSRYAEEVYAFYEKVSGKDMVCATVCRGGAMDKKDLTLCNQPRGIELKDFLNLDEKFQWDTDHKTVFDFMTKFIVGTDISAPKPITKVTRFNPSEARSKKIVEDVVKNVHDTLLVAEICGNKITEELFVNSIEESDLIGKLEETSDSTKQEAKNNQNTSNQNSSVTSQPAPPRRYCSYRCFRSGMTGVFYKFKTWTDECGGICPNYETPCSKSAAGEGIEKNCQGEVTRNYVK